MTAKVVAGAVVVAAAALLVANSPELLAAPIPLGPVHGAPCSDLDKLAFDPSVGQIACDGTSWVRSVEPTGIRALGTPCAPAELMSVMASTSDGHLIWCPQEKGVWVLYRQ